MMPKLSGVKWRLPLTDWMAFNVKSCRELEAPSFIFAFIRIFELRDDDWKWPPQEFCHYFAQKNTSAIASVSTQYIVWWTQDKGFYTPRLIPKQISFR